MHLMKQCKRSSSMTIDLGVVIEMPADLAVKVFRALHTAFFQTNGFPIPFFLRDKAQTQSDPLDEYISHVVLEQIAGVECIKAGSLTSPDLLVLDTSLLTGAWLQRQLDNINVALAIEVKKVQQDPNGKVARATGMDYNSTPPSSHVYVYDRSDKPFMVRCFYLFISTVAQNGQIVVTAMALCDGAALNTDVDLYKSIVQPREKELDLGSYGDGAIRSRPMMIFPNPLGVDFLRQTPSLIHQSATLEQADGQLKRVCTIKRTLPKNKGRYHTFYCYQDRRLAQYTGVREVTDPFPLPERRQQGRRGKLRAPTDLK